MELKLLLMNNHNILLIAQPDIEVGILVAVDLQQYEEWPQIGKVLHVTGETLTFSGMMVLTLIDTS